MADEAVVVKAKHLEPCQRVAELRRYVPGELVAAEDQVFQAGTGGQIAGDLAGEGVEA